MIYRIILKNFKSNLKSYFLFFLSEILAVTLIFSFYAMKDTMLTWTRQSITDPYLFLSVKAAVGVMIVVSVFQVAFSMKYYVQVRLRDYSLFLVLGMKKRMLLCSIAAEYLAGWVIAVITGLLCGNGIYLLFKKVVMGFYPKEIGSVPISGNVYGNTLLISGGLMLGVLVVIAVMLEEKGISELLEAGIQKEKRPEKKWWLVLALAGVVLFVLSIVKMDALGFQYLNKDGLYSLVGCIIGGILLLMFGGSTFLNRLKCQKNWYYKNLLSFNQLYYRYTSNISLVFALFMIQFITIAYMAVNISGYMPVSRSDSDYPYDIVWYASDTDQEYAKELAAKYEGDVRLHPMVRVTLEWNEENIGISETEYRKITGIKENERVLSGKEILYVSQETERERMMLQLSKSGKMPVDIHIGKLTKEMENMLLWDERWDEYYKKGYSIKKYERKNLFGYFSESELNENVYVFSDEYFQKEWERVRSDCSEPSILVLLSIPEKSRKQCSEDLEKYISKQESTILEESIGNRIYFADDMRESVKMASIMNIMVSLFLILTLYISGIFVIGMKTLSEIPAYRSRYNFLKCMGMTKKVRKQTMSREILGILNLPVWISYIFGIVFVIRLTQVRGLSSSEMTVFYQKWGSIVLLYLTVQLGVVWLMRCYLIREVEGKK